MTANLTMTVSATPVVVDCTPAAADTVWTITCDTDDAVIANITSFNLTVTETDPVA